ncbi:MAG: hypothetical protein QM764_07065 [Chitinophagaceae bacterium]
MKFINLFLISLLSLSITSCSIRKYTIKSQARVSEIEKSIHTQFYQALQKLSLEDGITIVPQSLTVKFEHTITKTASGGLTAFIVSANYNYQNVKDNTISDILTPTKLPSSSMHDISLSDTLYNNCAFNSEISNSDQVNKSILALKEYIESAAKEFVQTPNLGPLNDHQITIDIKFSFTNAGDITVSPGFTFFNITKITGKVSKTITSTDDLIFTFDVVQNDQSYFLSNNRYYFIRDSIIKSKGGICKFFPKDDYRDESHSKYLLTPPAADQDKFSSCVAYAVGYTGLSTKLNTRKSFDKDNEFSPDFIYGSLTNPQKCDGLNVPTVLQEVVDKGDCLVADLR